MTTRPRRRRACAPTTGRRRSASQREVRAVDDVSLAVAADEIYGLAGESSCGKTTLIKTIAAAIRRRCEVVGGTVTFNFAGRRDRHARAPTGASWRRSAGGISPTSCRAR